MGCHDTRDGLKATERFKGEAVCLCDTRSCALELLPFLLLGWCLDIAALAGNELASSLP